MTDRQFKDPLTGATITPRAAETRREAVERHRAHNPLPTKLPRVRKKALGRRPASQVHRSPELTVAAYIVTVVLFVLGGVLLTEWVLIGSLLLVAGALLLLREIIWARQRSRAFRRDESRTGFHGEGQWSSQGRVIRNSEFLGL